MLKQSPPIQGLSTVKNECASVSEIKAEILAQVEVSYILEFEIQGAMLNIRFPSNALVSVPIEIAVRNSMYFKMLSESMNNESINLKR